MKTSKKNIFYGLIFFSCINIFAQKENKSKFSIIGSGRIGYGIVENDAEVNYNLNSDSGDILINYNFSKKFGIASGVGLEQLTGNGFNSLGDFYHERNLLKIPILLTFNSCISENIEFQGYFGFYTQNIIKDNYTFLTNSIENMYKGWNYGNQVGVAVLFNFVPKMKFGVLFNAQSDWSKFKSNNSSISSKEKLKYLNSIGLVLKYKF